MVPDEVARYEDMDKVIALHVQSKQPTTIAKETGLQRKYVLELIDEWKASARHNDEMKERVSEAIRVMDEHYNSLIREAWKTLKQVDEKIAEDGIDHQILGQRTRAVSAIADLESKRIESMQKAGMLDAADMGDKFLEQEKKQQTLIDILRNELCVSCKKKVMTRLGDITGRTETVVTYND
jgi:hypothetical protein